MKKNELTTAQQKRLGVAALVTALVVMGLLVWLVGVPLVRFASQPERFRDWVDSHGFGGRLAYMGMVILQVVVALIPGEPFEIAAGYAFGAVEGTLLCLVASALGSVCVFCWCGGLVSGWRRFSSRRKSCAPFAFCRHRPSVICCS